MSKLRVNELAARTGNVITLAEGAKIYQPGTVIQAAAIRSDLRASYSSSNTGNGNPVTPLNLTITPVFANSLIVCQWMVNGELHQDNNFLIWKNGALALNGFNQESGNVRWSGYTSAFYDQNESSTPSNWSIIYTDVPGSTASTTYGLAVRSSSTGNYTFFLNRTVANAGGDAHETMVSVGIIQEIAQ
jgi:hypothetical protein